MKAENAILIGAMGAGKSTVGKMLAKKLKLQFYDSDKVVEQTRGRDVTTIFEHEGERAFRIYEKKAIGELCQLKGIVLATGGGAVLLKSTRDLLARKGTVFYLSASVDTLLDRTSGNSDRPLLQAPDRRQTITELLQKRASIYQKMADHVITTDHETVDQVVEQAAHFMQMQSGAKYA